MLTQAQADRLIATLKDSVRRDVFVWEQNQRQDELFIAVEDAKLEFVLTHKRNPFEIKLHLRTRDRDIGLARVDNHRYHCNPDGTELHGGAHLHLFREGYEHLESAEQVEWYDTSDPLRTLERFLGLVHAHFVGGHQLSMF